MESDCYLGKIDAENPHKISWHKVAHHTGVGRYRMAATGVVDQNKIIFLGGTHTPYNYNGMGYDGTPAEPVAEANVFDIKTRSWQRLALNHASMDHRALIQMHDQFITVGGMLKGQKVSARVHRHSLPLRSELSH